MKENWDFAFTKMIGHEQGFQDDPEDPGNKLPDGRPGCTNLGVTQRAWEAYVGRQVTHDDMRALTPATVKPFYKTQYWDKVRGDELSHGVDYVVFDTCVNSGPSRAIKILQEELGADVDGILGSMTLMAVHAVQSEALISDFCERRVAFMKSLPGWGRFGGGWERRVQETEKYALGLVPKDN